MAGEQQPSGVTGASSFNWEAYARQKQQEAVQAGHEGATLAAAAKLFLTDSSDSSAASGGAREGARSPAGTRAQEDGSSVSSGSTGSERKKRKKPSRHDGKDNNSHSKQKKKEKQGKHRRHKRRKTDAEKIAAIEAQMAASGQLPLRRGAVKGWLGDAAGTVIGPQLGDYYYDTKGDRDNLLYQSLYGADVAAYCRLGGLSVHGTGTVRRALRFGQRVATEADGHSQTDLKLAGRRYYSAAVVRKERSRTLRRIQLAQQAQENEAAAWLQGKGGGRGQEGLQGPLLAVLGLGSNRASRASAVSVADGTRRLRLPQPDFIPLKKEQEPAGLANPVQIQQSRSGVPLDVEVSTQQQEDTRQGESRTEWVLRRTRELNVATREQPFDLQMWLEFAAFQEEAAAVGAQKVSERATREKQISILERALAHHPGSEALLLALLKAVSSISDSVEVAARWQRVLARHPGSGLLWKHYLQQTRGAFATFATSTLRKGYCDAIAALRTEAHRRTDEGAPPGEVVKVEQAWVELFLQAVQFEMDAGYTEVAVAYIQTVLEFNFLAPPDHALPPQALGGAQRSDRAAAAAQRKRRAFEAYWESGAGLVGDAGGRGWGPGALQDPAAPPLPPEPVDGGAAAAAAQGVAGDDLEVGGWSGWVEVAPARRTVAHGEGVEGDEGGGASEERPPGAEEDSDNDADGQAADEDGVQLPPQETEEELMERLGMRLEADLAELEAQGTEAALDDTGMAAWLALEGQRDAEDWQPKRSCKQGLLVNGVVDAEADDDAAAVVDFDDVRDLLYTVVDEAQREALLLGCLSLLGAPLPLAWCSSNSTYWLQRALSATHLHDLGQLSGMAAWNVAGMRATAAGPLERGVDGQHYVQEGLVNMSDGMTWMQQWMGMGGAVVCGLAAEDGNMAAAADHPQGQELDAGAAQAAAAATRLLQQCTQEPWYMQQAGRRRFLQQLLQLLLTLHQPSSASLQELKRQDAGAAITQHELWLSWLHVEAAGPDGSLEAAREAAKKLLAQRSSDVMLWAAYATWEHQQGNSKVARRVIDATLQSLGSLQDATAAPFLLSLALAARLTQLAVQGAQQAAVRAWHVRCVSVAGPTGPAAQQQCHSAATAVQHALHVLSWLAQQAPGLTTAGPYAPFPKTAAPAALPTAAFVVTVRKGFQGWLSWLNMRIAAPAAPQVPRESDTGNMHILQALPQLVYCAAAYELLPAALHNLLHAPSPSQAPSAPPAGGPVAAAAVYDGVLRLTDGQTQRTNRHWELLHVLHCTTLVEQLYGNAVQRRPSGAPALAPSRVHKALTQALQLYPRNMQLLLLLCESEVRGHSVSRLRAALHALLRPSSSSVNAVLAVSQEPLQDAASPAAALLAARVELLRAGGAKGVPAVYESALVHPALRCCPLIWWQYMQYECGRRAFEAARRVYLRAINTCPGSKAVWVGGLTTLLGVMSAKERNELLEIAGSKGIRLRTDVYEILLQRMEGQLDT